MREFKKTFWLLLLVFLSSKPGFTAVIKGNLIGWPGTHLTITECGLYLTSIVSEVVRFSIIGLAGYPVAGVPDACVVGASAIVAKKCFISWRNLQKINGASRLVADDLMQSMPISHLDNLPNYDVGGILNLISGGIFIDSQWKEKDPNFANKLITDLKSLVSILSASDLAEIRDLGRIANNALTRIIWVIGSQDEARKRRIVTSSAFPFIVIDE